jgi:p-cumate 2,3-dioxygenase beta subunit
MTPALEHNIEAAEIRTQYEVERLMFAEAALLDDWRLDEWLTLLTDDCRYVVPSTDLPGGDPDADVVLIDDDRERLHGRVERMKSRFAHREYPWSRTRHLVTNVVVLSDDGERIDVRANFAVYRMRGNVSVYVGEYRYELIRKSGRLLIRRRIAVLDNERLDEHGAVSIIV